MFALLFCSFMFALFSVNDNHTPSLDTRRIVAPSTIIGYTSVDITPPPIFFVCTPKHQAHVGTFPANTHENFPANTRGALSTKHTQ